MFDDEKLRVTLNIAGEQVKTVINRSDEEELRMLEKEVTSLFNRWRVADPSRTKSQVLAMVAFQYAKLYYDDVPYFPEYPLHHRNPFPIQPLQCYRWIVLL